MSDSSYEVVHFVEGFVDGVLNGTADCEGAPHHFELRSAEPDAAEVYRLTPLTPAVFAAVVEAWQIWGRHGVAVPALPADRERLAELRVFITHFLEAARPGAFLAEGDFEQVSAHSGPGVGRAALRVRWNKL
jgi:hypothetical protein